MAKAIELDIHGLKCDNKDCDYRDDNIPVGSYIHYVGAPCPKCGQNLLTKKDYYLVKGLLNLAKALNEVLPDKKDTDKLTKLALKMNGTGSIGIEEIKEKDTKL